MRFEAQVELHGKTATGIAVPEAVLAGLEGGKRPAVKVTINGYSFRSTIASMRGEYLLPLSAENREAAGVAAGDHVDVDVELESAPRQVAIPDDLAAALAAEPDAAAYLNGLAFTYRKEWVRWIEEAKKPETRAGRVEKTLAALKDRRPTR